MSRNVKNWKLPVYEMNEVESSNPAGNSFQELKEIQAIMGSACHLSVGRRINIRGCCLLTPQSRGGSLPGWCCMDVESVGKGKVT